MRIIQITIKINYLNLINQLNNLLKYIQLLYNIIIFYININNLN